MIWQAFDDPYLARAAYAFLAGIRHGDVGSQQRFQDRAAATHFKLSLSAMQRNPEAAIDGCCALSPEILCVYLRPR